MKSKQIFGTRFQQVFIFLLHKFILLLSLKTHVKIILGKISNINWNGKKIYFKWITELTIVGCNNDFRLMILNYIHAHSNWVHPSSQGFCCPCMRMLLFAVSTVCECVLNKGDDVVQTVAYDTKVV